MTTFREPGFRERFSSRPAFDAAAFARKSSATASLGATPKPRSKQQLRLYWPMKSPCAAAMRKHSAAFS